MALALSRARSLSLSTGTGDRAGPALTPRACAQPRFIGGQNYPGGGLPPPGSAEQQGKVPRLTIKQNSKTVCKLRLRQSAAVGDYGVPGQKHAFPCYFGREGHGYPTVSNKD